MDGLMDVYTPRRRREEQTPLVLDYLRFLDYVYEISKSYRIVAYSFSS
jgi:hypothetical protein